MCIKLCEITMTADNVGLYKWLISNKYYGNWYIDNLPSGLNTGDGIEKEEVRYDKGIPLGDVDMVRNYNLLNSKMSFTFTIILLFILI